MPPATRGAQRPPLGTAEGSAHTGPVESDSSGLSRLGTRHQHPAVDAPGGEVDSQRAREILDHIVQHVREALLRKEKRVTFLDSHLVTREEWGAQPAKTPYDQLESTMQRGVAVHHSGSQHERRQQHAQCAGVVRAIQAYHIDARGWNDIAYSWLCCQHGFLYEGRGLGVRSASQGTHEGNSDWHSVCWLGDGDVWTPTPNNVLPLRDVLRMVRTRYPAAVDVWPHLRFHPTACPGHGLREWCRQFPDLTPEPFG